MRFILTCHCRLSGYVWVCLVMVPLVLTSGKVTVASLLCELKLCEPHEWLRSVKPVEALKQPMVSVEAGKAMVQFSDFIWEPVRRKKVLILIKIGF